MIRFFVTSILTLLGNALGIIVAALVLPGFHIQPLGFIVSVLFFTGADILLRPFVIKMSLRYIPALRGGIALITTFVGLFLTVLFTSGLRIDDVSTWVIAPLIIWLAVVLAGILLPMMLFKEILQKRNGHNDDPLDKYNRS
ncbi:hypothetical protein EOL96_06425 [Candidatus Saccharibacteria bacterium]|nr:hypothetical protein [Candidatus Saccharibacteria bacterium]